MKTTPVRELRARLAEFLDGRDPVLITRHGKYVGVLYPLKDSKRIPPEVRTPRIAGKPGTEEHAHAFTQDPVIEAFKRDVDRTLIRENLRRTPEERLQQLEALQRLAEETRQARPRGRK